MKPKEAKYIFDTIEDEGFSYAFLDYSEFKEIDDEEFHHLRRRFCEAAGELGEYLGVDV